MLPTSRCEIFTAALGGAGFVVIGSLMLSLADKKQS